MAAHYVDAFEANPDAPDAAEVRRLAHEALVRAGDRAESLAAAREAQRYLVQAADRRERGSGVLEHLGDRDLAADRADVPGALT